jgi:hypothetical protein
MDLPASWIESLPIRDLVPLVAAIGGSLAGAWWGARLRLKQQHSVELKELTRWQESQRNQKLSFLRSILAEMNILWRRYNDLLGEDIETLKLEDIRCINHRFTQDYFTVYHSSAATLGLIDNSEVPFVVIDAYLQAKAVIDIVHVISSENIEIKRLEEDMNSARPDSKATVYLSRQIATLLGDSEARYRKICSEHAKFKHLVGELNRILDAEVTRLSAAADGAPRHGFQWARRGWRGSLRIQRSGGN